MVYRATIIGIREDGRRGVVKTIHKPSMKQLIAEAVKPLKDPWLLAHFYWCRDTGSPSQEYMGVMRA